MLNANEKKPNKIIPKPTNKHAFPKYGMILIKKEKESNVTITPIISIKIDFKILFINIFIFSHSPQSLSTTH
jgi:hypothetical protein